MSAVATLVQSKDVRLDRDGVLSGYTYGQLTSMAKVSRNRFPAVYAIEHSGALIYFGESAIGLIRSLKGFRFYSKHGLAYKWRTSYKNSNLTMHVFRLKSRQRYFDQRRYRQAVEAELTFKFRTRGGAWPKSRSSMTFCEQLRTESLVNTAVADVITTLEGKGLFPPATVSSTGPFTSGLMPGAKGSAN